MLAQEWLYGNRVSTEFDRHLERHLKQPTEYDPRSSIAILNHIAERIVFTDDVPSMLYEMHDNKQLTYQGVLSSAKLPYDCFWLEYNTLIGVGSNNPEEGETDIEYVSNGALIQRINNDLVRMYIVSGVKPREHPFASTLTHIIDFNAWPPVIRSDEDFRWRIQFAIRYAFNEGTLRNSLHGLKATGEVGSIVCEVIFGIFLVTQPRVYTDEAVRWKASHKQARAKSNKPPLLEYRRIRLHICKPRKHYGQRPAITRSIGDTDSTEAVQHRRYHKVMGHFRHYINHDPPHTTWIEPHYRGDPALGVTFTERDVSR